MSTTTVKVNELNDLAIDEFGNLIIIEDVAAVAQDVRLNTLMRTGEDIFDVQAGVDYFQYIFTPQQDYDEARRSLSSAILASPSVLSIDQLSITLDAETFNFTAQINTVFGQLTVRNT